MEQQIESCIDNFFDKIAPQLQMFNIALGLVLLIIGVFLLVKTSKKGSQTMGFVCAGIGVLSVLINVTNLF